MKKMCQHDNTIKYLLNFQLAEYTAAQDEAKKARLNMWRYGDITEDDDKEFGLGR